jgi:hypothetical protein
MEATDFNSKRFLFTLCSHSLIPIPSVHIPLFPFPHSHSLIPVPSFPFPYSSSETA